jgi:hypothetical protein
MNMKKVNFMLPPKLIDALKAAADDQGINGSEWVRQTLWQEIDRLRETKMEAPLEIDHLLLGDFKK